MAVWAISFPKVTIRLRTGSGDEYAVFGGNCAHVVRLAAVDWVFSRLFHRTCHMFPRAFHSLHDFAFPCWSYFSALLIGLVFTLCSVWRQSLENRWELITKALQYSPIRLHFSACERRFNAKNLWIERRFNWLKKLLMLIIACNSEM